MKILILLSWLVIWEPIVSIAQSQELLLYVENHNPYQKEFRKENKIQEIFLLYQNEFSVQTGLFNEVLFKKNIEKKIPYVNQQGYAVLDWEGSALHSLYLGSKGYDKTLHEFIRAIRTAKLLRPNIKWGFYGFPPIIVNNYNASKLRSDRILPILKNSDFIAPVLYIPGSTDNFPYGTQESYIDLIVKLSLELSSQIKKPVYPFIWHRYADYRDRKDTYRLVDINQFESFVSRILNVGYNRKKVSGVIWWSSEDNGFNNRNIDKLIPIQKEYQYMKISEKGKYQKEIFKKYYSVIAKYFK